MTKAAQKRTLQTEGPSESQESAPTGPPAAVTHPALLASDAAPHLRELLDSDGGGTSRRRLLSPFQIHFSQSHIRPEFQDGKTVEDSVAQVKRELLTPLALESAEDDTDSAVALGAPVGDCNWWLLRPPFPEIEVIQWRIKLRGEDGAPQLDDTGMELYGEKEWYTLDNRRLYCLQKAATAVYPSEVRCVVSVIYQEDGNYREFRKFRTFDRGRSVGVGHRDSADLPRWSWRHEVGLPDEELPAGSVIAKPARRRGPNSRGGYSNGKSARRRGSEERGKWDFLVNASVFILVYLALRVAICVGRQLLTAGFARSP